MYLVLAELQLYTLLPFCGSIRRTQADGATAQRAESSSYPEAVIEWSRNWGTGAVGVLRRLNGSNFKHAYVPPAVM
jgi:hypothetical protein